MLGKNFTSCKGDDFVFTPYSLTEQFSEGNCCYITERKV
jgi:hypothetical protein